MSQSASDAFRLSKSSPTVSSIEKEQSQHFNERSLLMEHLTEIICPILESEHGVNKGNKQNLVILVKGSRSAQMERVIEEIKQWYCNSTYKEQANKLIKANEMNNESKANTAITQKGSK